MTRQGDGLVSREIVERVAAVDAVLGKRLASVAQLIERTSILHEVACEEVEGVAGLPEDVMGSLRPPVFLLDLSAKVYRAWVREKLAQILKGTSHPTDVECALVLSKASLKAPLVRPYAVAYWLAFKGIEPLPADFSKSDIEDGKRALEEVRDLLKRRRVSA